MRPEIYILYGIPTIFLAIGLVMYTIVRLESRRYDRRAAEAQAGGNKPRQA